MKNILFLLLLTTALFFTPGCNKDDDPEPFIGIWALYDQTPGVPPKAWYIHIEDNGKYYFSKTKNSTGIIENYNVDNDKLIGTFTNPNAGKGRIEAVIKDGSIKMDFIEYWHTPHKVIKYMGHKV